MQIAVIGMHRSGTSVLSRLLNLMGIYFAPEGMGTGANQENPKGFWERRDVRSLNDHVLHSMGCDWNRVAAFDVSKAPAALVAEFDKRAAQIVLSMDAYRPWFIKEPRLCLLLPLWRRMLEAPLCIHILRHPVEVASSLNTRNGIPMAAGLALWEHYNRSALAAMQNLPVITLTHRDLIQSPVETLTTLHGRLESLGAGRMFFPDSRQIESFVSSELYREREGERGLDAFADAPQIKLFDQWASGKRSSGKVGQKQSAEGLRALEAYEATLPPLQVPAQQKKPGEMELKAQIAAAERNMEVLKERLETARAELGQRNDQLLFLEGEFSALREQASRKEQSAEGVIASMQKMLAERDAWLREREKSAESERLHARDEAGRASALLEAVKTASVAAERNHMQDVARLTAECRELERRLALESELASEKQHLVDIRLREADQVRHGLAAALEQSQQDSTAAAVTIENLRLQLAEAGSDMERRDEDRTRLALALEQSQQASRTASETADALRLQLAERFAEVAKITRLYLDQKARNDHLIAKQLQMDEKMSSECASFQEREFAMRRDMGGLSERLASIERHSALLERQLAREQIESVQALAEVREKAELYRKTVDFQRAEMVHMEQSLAGIRSSSSWRATAPLRKLRAVLSGGVAVAGSSAVSSAALLKKSRWFDADWYVAHYADVAVSGLEPEIHFLVHGAGEGRNPSADFDTNDYLANNPDVSASGQNPLIHFILHGESEGRAVKRGKS